MELVVLGILVSAVAIPFGMLFKGQSEIRKELSGVERGVLLKDEVEKMIGLYTNPIKSDIEQIQRGVNNLSIQFRELELLIARELGRRDGEDKDNSK